jgi:hypothetical protein
MTKGSVSKKNAPRKRHGGDVMSTAAVSMIINGVKYRAGQKPARVYPPTRPFTASERFMTDALSAVAGDIQQLRADRAPLRKGRAEGAKGKRTQRLAKRFDLLFRDNPDLSAEEVRELKAPLHIQKMPKSTFARHWSAAEKRSQK